MKYLYLLPLIVLFGCSSVKYTSDDDRWLKAAQRMILVNHDPLVSTRNPHQVKMLVQWASKNGFKKIQITINYEPTLGPVDGDRPGMVFVRVQ